MEIAKDLIRVRISSKVCQTTSIYLQVNPSVPIESSADLHSELIKAFQNVSLSFQNDEVDEGSDPSLQESPQNLITATTHVGETPHHVGEIPHLVEVWGIDPLMKKYFELIYPSSRSLSSQW